MALPIMGQTVYAIDGARVVEGEVRVAPNGPSRFPRVVVYSPDFAYITRIYHWGMDCFQNREMAEEARRDYVRLQIQALQAQIDELRATL